MVQGKLDHVGIAVRDFDATAAVYGRLGFGVTLMPGSPWQGSRGTNAYLQPPAGSGLVVELIEKSG